MTEVGGSTTQTGIYYQNSVSALYLGRLLDASNRPDSERVEKVRVEAPTEVDDTVITFADGHQTYIQSKEHLKHSGDEWKTLWKHFDKQFRGNEFRLNQDRLYLCIGFGLQEHYDLRGICERAANSLTEEEWQKRLSDRQKDILDKIMPYLNPTGLTREYLREFLAHIDIEIMSRDEIERDKLRDWMPNTNRTQKELFRLLRDRIGGKARVKGIFKAHSLHRDLLLESPDLKFNTPSDIGMLRDEIKSCGSLLRQHQNVIAGPNIHIKREVVHQIIEWSLSENTTVKNVAMLLDQAGMGKSVVMRDVLLGLENRNVDTLAIKADQQLSETIDLSDIQRKLGFSYPLEQIISRLAKLNRVVILIDQIDALSLSLAHDQQSMNVTIDLVARLRQIPNVRILLSCRIFDRNTDPRLKAIETDQVFSIPRLSEAEVNGVLNTLRVNYSQLTPATKDLLGIPLHLDLFARALDSNDIGFEKLRGISSLQELYALIWQNVIVRSEIGSPPISDRIDVINRLTGFMDSRQRTSAPQSVLQTSETRHLERAVNWLASTGILIRGKTDWNFIHQTFFDYCYARRFVEQGNNIFETLLASKQGVFERPKLIQIISYLRTYDHPQYLRDLQNLLFSNVLRFHLYDLLLNWFGGLQNPKTDEWNLALKILGDDQKFSRLLIAMYGNPEWFKYLTPFIPHWLEDEERQAVTLGYFRSIIDHSQHETIQILERFLGKSDMWNEQIALSVFHIRNWQTDNAVSLFEKTIYQLKSPLRRDLLHLEKVCEISPISGCRIIRYLFDQALNNQMASSSQFTSSFFLDNELRELEGTIENAMKIVGEKVPTSYLEIMFPWVVKVVTVVPYSDQMPRFTSDALSYNWYDSTFNIQNTFVHSIINALTQVAHDEQNIFQPISQQLKNLSYQTPQQLLAYVYSSLPEQYAEDAFNFLITDQRRYGLGEEQFDSRRLISAIFPFLSSEQKELLESNILQFSWPVYKELGLHGLRWSGFEQYRLLHSIPVELLSLKAKKRLAEWQRKFPDTPISDKPPMGTRGGFVPSPIPNEHAKKMSNKNWLQAMGKYKTGINQAGPFGGGAHQLSGVLLNEIKNDPERFHKLFKEVPGDIHDSYVSAFANGFIESNSPSDWVYEVFRRYAQQDNRHVKRDLSYAVQKLAKHGVPEDIVLTLFSWIYTSEGEDESWWSKGDTNGDIYNSYLNSDRGAAFNTLMRILDEKSISGVSEEKWQLVEFASLDNSFALRLGAIEELTYLIHHDRERSWLLFEKLISGHALLLETHHVREFLHWSLYKNFLRVKPFIEKMIASTKPEVQEMGAELACIAAISETALESEDALTEAVILADETIKGSNSLRRGAASVYIFNMTKGTEPHIRKLCLEKVRTLVNDEDENIRNKIIQPFFSLGYEFFFDFRNLMEDIALSEYYPVNLQFTEYLWKHGMQDPNWTLSVIQSLTEKTIQLQHWVAGAEELIRFSLQVFTSPIVDDSTRDAAMNIFDLLIKKYSNAANTVLAEWDRR